MYYIHNVNKLGEKLALVYANKYVNFLHLKCEYSDKNKVITLCPDSIKNIHQVPQFFINMIKNRITLKSNRR